jgi:hypothetical protein
VGFTVSVAVFVTPAPETEIVTVVGALTGIVLMLNPPVVDPAGTITELFTWATDGLLLASGSWTSLGAGDARVTVPKEPDAPVVELGLRVSDAGGCCGVNVVCPWTDTPFQLAVTVTTVFVVTALVGIRIETEASPAATVAVAGGLAAGELLDKLATAPPAGASPFSITMAPSATPPVLLLGSDSVFSDGGCTVKVMDVDVPLRVAVSWTGAGVVTWPVWNPNWAKAKPAGTVNVAGTGAAVWLLLVRLTTAPPAGAGPVSWTVTVSVSPLNGEAMESASELMAAVEGTTNERVADQAVTAGTPGAESPCIAFTRQNLVPAVSDVTVQWGPVI